MAAYRPWMKAWLKKTTTFLGSGHSSGCMRWSLWPNVLKSQSIGGLEVPFRGAEEGKDGKHSNKRSA